MRIRVLSFALRIAFTAAIAFILLAAISSRPTKRLIDFDQSFYLTIAYDLGRYGVFSNGVFDQVDSTATAPPPGMFFSPLYPWIIFGAMKVDHRFNDAVVCSILANEKHRSLSDCEIYAWPMHIAHAAFLVIGVLAIAMAGEIISGGVWAFYLAGSLAAAGLAAEAELLSYIMTESIAFALFSVAGTAVLMALNNGRTAFWGAAGFAAGFSCLVRPSYLLLIPITACIILINARWLKSGERITWGRHLVASVAGALIVLTPWLARNVISLGKVGFTEEYGAATLIERFAFNGMTGREFVAAFPYCVPGIGRPLTNALIGSEATGRFEWNEQGSFFEQGRSRRTVLVETYGRLDPIMPELLRTELRRDWWRHIATTVPLAWCGVWVSGIWSLLLIPAFAWALVDALRRRQPLFALYAIPALLFVVVHAALANHYPRYNLGLIGPISVGAAWLAVRHFPSIWRRHTASTDARPVPPNGSRL